MSRPATRPVDPLLGEAARAEINLPIEHPDRERLASDDTLRTEVDLSTRICVAIALMNLRQFITR